MEKTPETVLVTGGAGFIGSHLCEHYLGKGCHVICLDNLFTGRKENIQKFLGNPHFEFVRHDIVEPYLAEVDLIMNFACPASPIHYQFNPIKTFKTSVMGTMNMLGLAKRVGARLVQASTSEVYGDPEVHPQPESYQGNVNPIGIRSCYDEGKRAAETMCSDYRREHQVDSKIIRIFNTYGPQMAVDDGRVVSTFICQALAGQDITIFGDGTQTRSFCYVDDLVNGITKMAASEKDFWGPMNLGSQFEFTMKELADKVLEMTKSSSKVVYKPLPSDDPKIRRPITTLAKEKLGWDAEVSLENGLAKTIPYFREQLGK